MTTLGRATWYLDADTLGLAHILVRARPDVPFPGDDGVRHTPRWSLPPCMITETRTPDVDWIPQVAAAGLAIITRDRAILSRRREVDAVLAARAQLFAITGVTQLSNWRQLEIVVRQWEAMETIRDTERGPFVYLVSRTILTRAELT